MLWPPFWSLVLWYASTAPPARCHRRLRLDGAVWVLSAKCIAYWAVTGEGW